MKRKRHNPEQIIKKLREADGMLASGKTIGQAFRTAPRETISERSLAGRYPTSAGTCLTTMCAT